MPKFLAFALLAAVSVAAPAFAAHPANHAPAPKAAHQVQHQAAPSKAAPKAQYACPMRCTTEVAKAPGNCSICGMALEKLPAKSK